MTFLNSLIFITSRDFETYLESFGFMATLTLILLGSNTLHGVKCSHTWCVFTRGFPQDLSEVHSLDVLGMPRGADFPDPLLRLCFSRRPCFSYQASLSTHTHTPGHSHCSRDSLRPTVWEPMGSKTCEPTEVDELGQRNSWVRNLELETERRSH